MFRLILKLVVTAALALLVSVPVLVASSYLPPRLALAVSLIVFGLSCLLMLNMVFGGHIRGLLVHGKYRFGDIVWVIPAPFLLVVSFASLCFQIARQYPGFFYVSRAASGSRVFEMSLFGYTLGYEIGGLYDFMLYALDNVLKTLFIDAPEIFGLSISPIFHNVDNALACTLVLLFRTMLSLGLLRAIALLLSAK